MEGESVVQTPSSPSLQDLHAKLAPMFLASPPLLPAGEPTVSSPFSPGGEEILISNVAFSASFFLSRGRTQQFKRQWTFFIVNVNQSFSQHLWCKFLIVQVEVAELLSARVQVGAVYRFNHHCLHLLGNPPNVLYPKSVNDSLFLFTLHWYMNCNDTLPSGGESGGATTSSAPSSLLHCSVAPVPEDCLALFSCCLNYSVPSGHHLQHLHFLYFLWLSFMHIKLVQQSRYYCQPHPWDASISLCKFGAAFIGQDVLFALILEIHPGLFPFFLLWVQGGNNPSNSCFPNGGVVLTLKCGAFLYSSVPCNNVLFSGLSSKEIMGPSEEAAILAPQVKFSVSIPMSPSPNPLQCVLDEALQALPRSGYTFLDVIPGYPIDTTQIWIDIKGFCLWWLILPSTPTPAVQFN